MWELIWYFLGIISGVAITVAFMRSRSDDAISELDDTTEDEWM